MAYLGKTRIFTSVCNADESSVGFARELRKNMTRSEKILWERLRRKNIKGVRFRRQQPVKYYVADFYCHEARLVVEVDGPIHQRPERMNHDKNRTAVLNRLGIKVIRFTNSEVRTKIWWVLKVIREETEARLNQNNSV